MEKPESRIVSKDSTRRDNFTNTAVGRLKPEASPYEVWDAGLMGLLIRVQPSGVMTYYLQYARGKRVRIGRADAIVPTQAREIAKGILAEHYKGEDPIEKRKRVRAENYLQFLEDTYKPWLLTSLRRGKETYDNLSKGFPELHSLSLSEITPLVIEKWRQRRITQGISKARINRQMNDLRACLNRAVQWGALKVSPFEKVKPCKIDSSPKVRYLSTKEETKLRQALDEREATLRESRQSANQWRAERGYELYAELSERDFADHLKPAVLLSLNTGLRAGELFGLKWCDVSFEQKNMTVVAETAKAGKTRHIPLNDEALAILKQWKQQPGVKSAQYVFAGSNGKPFQDMRTSWERVLKLAEIDNFRWHDLRHTFASKLVMAGVDLNTVRELLGHSNYAMTLRYAHLAPEHKALAVSKLVSS